MACSPRAGALQILLRDRTTSAPRWEKNIRRKVGILQKSMSTFQKREIIVDPWGSWYLKKKFLLSEDKLIIPLTRYIGSPQTCLLKLMLF